MTGDAVNKCHQDIRYMILMKIVLELSMDPQNIGRGCMAWLLIHIFVSVKNISTRLYGYLGHYRYKWVNEPF